MRRNIKNDKVIKAITIGLATMIAATSAPINVLADDGESAAPTTDSAPAAEAPSNDPAPAPAAEPAPAPAAPTAEAPAPAAETPAPVLAVTAGGTAELMAAPAETTSTVDVSKVEGGAEALQEAADIVSGIDSEIATVKTYQVEGDAYDAATLEELGTAKTNAEKAEDDLKKGAVAIQTAIEQGVQDVEIKKDATALKADIDKIKHDYDKDENDPEHGRDNKDLWHRVESVLTVNRDENGEFVLDKDGNPTYITKKNLQLICDDYYKDSYQAAKAEITTVLKKGLQNGETAEQWAERVAGLINKGQEEINNNPVQAAAIEARMQAIDDAIADAEAAAGINVKDFDLINTSIKDSNSAKKALERAKAKAKILSDLRDAQYNFTESFYKNDFYKTNYESKAEFTEDGKLDIEKTGKNVDSSKMTKENGWNIGNRNTINYGRSMMDQAIKYDLGQDESIDLKTYKRSNNKDENGRFEVKYKDASGVEQVLGSYNYKLKTPDADGKVDVTTGVAVLVKTGENGSKELVNELDYTALNTQAKKHDEVIAAIEKTSDKITDLTNKATEIKAVAESLKTKTTSLQNILKLKDNYNYKWLKTALENTKIACENSQKGLDDIKDLFDFLCDRFEIDNPLKQEPEELDGPGETADETPGGDDTAGGDDETTGGGTVIDGGDVSVVIPGGYTLPAGLLDAFGGTGTTGGGTTSGVLGVRTGGGNAAEAFGNGAADDQTGAVSKADFSTVNKVLGSKQKKDNSQLAKKIKDNEIPLAEIPNMDDEVTMNWMWLLIIFLLGATGKKMYDEYKKKKEAEEAAKIDK